MGIGSHSVNMLFSLYLDGHLRGFKSVMEIGSQTLHTDVNGVTLAARVLTKNPILADRLVKTSRDFHAALGFEEYQCIDADGAHGALVFDLNRNIRQTYGYEQQFDFVTNHGTTEHCFDQHHAFLNIHNLCRKGGIMLHALPFQGYVNHGFYNYQPAFFHDLARANDYDLLGLYLNIDSTVGDVCSYSDALMRHLTITPLSTMLLFVVLRKTSDSEFRSPFDGHFEVASRLNEGYRFQRVPKIFLPVGFEEIGWIMPGPLLCRIFAARVWRRFLRTLRLQ